MNEKLRDLKEKLQVKELLDNEILVETSSF
jgi:hypothetical protein